MFIDFLGLPFLISSCTIHCKPYDIFHEFFNLYWVCISKMCFIGKYFEMHLRQMVSAQCPVWVQHVRPFKRRE